uniref:Secreted protein n=1 Tax=Cacopsylla melanoneura TaxID=428564 RepID=A0A8D8TIB9_9HEMI
MRHVLFFFSFFRAFVNLSSNENYLSTLMNREQKTFCCLSLICLIPELQLKLHLKVSAFLSVAHKPTSIKQLFALRLQGLNKALSNYYTLSLYLYTCNCNCTCTCGSLLVYVLVLR